MSELHSSIDLPYSIDKLWSVLPDLNKYDEWMTIHTGFKGDVPAIEDIKVGTKFSEIVTLMGMANTVEWTVQEFTPADKVLSAKRGAFKLGGTGMAGVEAVIKSSVEEIDADNTRVNVDSSFTGQMLTGAIGTAIDKAVQEELENSVARLKELLAKELG